MYLYHGTKELYTDHLDAGAFLTPSPLLAAAYAERRGGNKVLVFQVTETEVKPHRRHYKLLVPKTPVEIFYLRDI